VQAAMNVTQAARAAANCAVAPAPVNYAEAAVSAAAHSAAVAKDVAAVKSAEHRPDVASSLVDGAKLDAPPAERRSADSSSRHAPACFLGTYSHTFAWRDRI